MVHIILRNVYTKHKVHQIAHKYIDIFISVVVLVSLCFYLIWQMLVVMLAMRVSVYMCLLIHLRVCVYMCLSGEAMLCDSNYSSIYVYSIGYVYIKYAYGRPIVIRLKFCSNRFACATQHSEWRGHCAKWLAETQNAESCNSFCVELETDANALGLFNTHKYLYLPQNKWSIWYNQQMMMEKKWNKSISPIFINKLSIEQERSHKYQLKM